ncbi:hypothetical protein FRC00_004089 [Tulasnella sp. 408]|nr:hypothetical protein FRC00_004089 [Tulasnella sp. 408]
MFLSQRTSSYQEHIPSMAQARGSNDLSISHALASFGDKIRAAQKWTQSLAHSKPIQRYTRLVRTVCKRFKLKTEEGHDPKAKTLVDDDFGRAQVDGRGGSEILAGISSAANTESCRAKKC